MVSKFLDHLEEWVIATLMGLATLVIFVAVIHRFLSAVPVVQDVTLRMNLTWAQELCIYMFVWMAKFGAAYGVRTGIHVGVDVVLRKCPTPLYRKVVVFGLLAGALFTGIVGTLGARFVWENGAHYAFVHAFGLPATDLFEGPTTPDLEWPTWIVYSAVPLGSYLMCLRFLQVALSFKRTGELPHHDHGHVEGMEELEKDPLLVGDALAEGEAISREGGKGSRA